MNGDTGPSFATGQGDEVRAGEALGAAQAAALRQSEERYRTLFQAIDEGFCVIEMLFDPRGAPCDYRFLELNPAFERHTGLGGAVGRTVRELVPGHEAHWFEIYGRVALTGEPERFGHHAAGLGGRWFDVYAFRVGPPEDRQVAVLFNDVTGRKCAEAALRESEARWRAVFENMHEGFALCEMVYGLDGAATDFRYLEVNAAWERLTGIPPSAVVGRLAAEAIPGIEQFWADTCARVAETGEPAHFEYYLAVLGRWFEVYAYRTEPGRFAALFLNVTERKAAEERQALLMREVDHRAKNALAVVRAALRLTKSPDVLSYMRAIEGRVDALARAQTLLADDRWAGADLRTMLRGELAMFLDDSRASGPRAGLEGPAVTLPAGAAQPLAMAAHELATNAVKYGALSVPAGRVSISWRLDGGSAGTLRLRWAETGGPPVVGPPGRRGFGSRVVETTVRSQLGGNVSFVWEAAGLVCDIELSLARTAMIEASIIPDEDAPSKGRKKDDR